MAETTYAVRGAVLQHAVNILKRLPWEEVQHVMPELLQSQPITLPTNDKIDKTKRNRSSKNE